MFSNLKGWEWLIIVALILLLFGAKRLPDAARGLGRSMRIFKAETKGLTGNDTDEDSKSVESSQSPAKAVEANDTVEAESQESLSREAAETKPAAPTER
ncbi:MAG: Sec-independent protein translocase subunit TatA [Candidatus Nanopelagicales bacterium]|jgi:sec-independent protein translocase protein TatA|nr:Sec-independent protein translocase subunit TatA [Actinomycetes bacterium]MCH9738428.1 Sec-independent protein translocase subunit TatA [Actinomycetes bacterium]MCH9840331.1 Sec-independent protein translocase subunit TatA [Actinomycetes bacterium]